MVVAGRRSILCGACPLPLPPPLYFPTFICVMGACLQGGMGAHGWFVRFFQPSVQSPSWSWLRIVEALNVNLEMSRCCHSLWLSLHFLETRVWPLLCWGFSFRTSFCLFYIMVANSGKRLPHSHLALITHGTLGHTALTPEFWWVPHWQYCNVVAW